jgi:polyphosphate kinase 2 (PPK2 family)
VLERTSTKHAPWYVIPADKKWYRNWAVATIVTGVLEDMELTWPRSPDDLTGVVVD